MDLLKLAWRNIWRNRRRTLLTMTAVVFAMLIIVLTRSLQFGTYDAMELQAVRMMTGEVQIQRDGYQDERTFAYSIDLSEAGIDAALDGLDWVEASSPRVTGFGLVSSDASSTGAMIIGVDPEREPTVSDFVDRVEEGSGLTAGPGGQALVGETLARNLDTGVGDTLVVITQGYQNQMGADLYVIAGLLSTGSVELDRSLMVLTFEDAQTLFSMWDRATEVVVRTADFREAPAYAEAIRGALPEPYTALDWDTLMPELRQIIALDNASGAIFLVFMLLLVGFEIMNTTTMSVVERIREFGVLQALGMMPGRLAQLVFLELTLKLGIALLAAMLAGGLLLFYLEGNPIPLTADMIEMYEEFGFSLDSLLFSTRPRVFVEPFISILIITGLAIVYPVVRVFRLNAIHAIRRGT